MTITIIHFNDCYNIEPSAQSSGAAGFLTAINQHRHLNPMILFSGDIISPSFMSTFTKGEQMIPVLNDIGVDCAVFGNHEFDYGVDNLTEFVKRTTFPWLLSNVIDKETSNQLGDGKLFHIIEREGIRFGLIGLIEEEWLSTLSTLDSSDVIYEDFVVKGRQLAKQLKSEPYNVDYVIALTHSRTPNDIRLADSAPEIDLILGGHDHDYEIIQRPNCNVIKSGTDFREFSKLTLEINKDYLNAKDRSALKPFNEPMKIERVECLNYEQNEELKKKLDKFVKTIDEKMDKVLGQFNCDLDGRFSSIRRTETNLGNFVTDIMLASTHADVAILNSGTLRSDRIHPKGDFTMRDLFNILGYIDPIAVLLSTGHEIWKALENGVSQWPKLEGRFPQVSGCVFTFDPSKPPMHRIDPKDIMIGDELLVLDKQYKLTTKAYLASGRDGYDMLKKCKVLVPGDESPDLTTSILNHFEAINMIKSNRRTHHRQSIICLSRNSLQKILDQTSSSQQECSPSSTSLMTPTSTTPIIIDKQNNYVKNNNIVNGNTNSHNDNNGLNNNGVNNNNNIYPPSLLASPQQANSFDMMGSIQESPSLEVDTSLKENNLPIISDDNNNKQQQAAATTTINNHSDGNNEIDTKNHPNYNHHDQSMIVNNFRNGLSNHHNSFTPVLSKNPNSITIGSSPQVMGGEGEVGVLNSSIVSSTPLITTSNSVRMPRSKRIMSLYEIEQEQCQLDPKIEGRIRIVGVNC